ncbi:MAG: hypothetical protein SFV81_27955 [Pirellulaceae bacterium]|nr:hypothetical protein [Pirellulaceae bacterium]
MVSAAIWLDQLGIPPREVCLDWAWQIESQFADARTTIRCETATLDWQRIEVSNTGELLMPPDFQNYSPTERLHELLSWAEGGEVSKAVSLPAHRDSEDLLKQLRGLTVGCITETAKDANANPVAMNETAHVLSAQTKVEAEFGPSPNSLLSLQRSPSSRQLKKKPSASNSLLTNQLSGVLQQPKLIAVLACVGIACGIFALNIGAHKDSASESIASSQPQELKNKELNTGKTREDETEQELDDASALATIPEMPTLEMSEPGVADIAPPTMPSISNSLIAGLDRTESRNLPDSSVAEGVGKEAELAVVPTDTEPSGIASATEASDASDLLNRDVMQELEGLTKSAASQALETDLELSGVSDGVMNLDSVGSVPGQSNVGLANTGQEDSGQAEPIMLRTSPMNQTHKLASKIKFRPRQPIWHIRLSVDDEFELTPREPQDVSDRQVTTWLLSDTDAKNPAVRLVIQVQGGPGRQTALRWRIFASAEDLPDLMLPLDKELLNPLQDRLRFYAQMSQREADRLRQLASVAERGLRATFQKQRVTLESQSKLASRLSTMVAEARLLDDLLRSQVTVHAKLLDGADKDGQPFLQFGEPDDERVDERGELGPSEVEAMPAEPAN